ncbi:alpha/beta hydrolase, partial [Rhizobiaceae sp. 2RAB30]
VVDLTKLKTGDSLNHGKFAESPEIVQLIGQRIANGQPLTSNRGSLSNSMGAVLLGTATAVGSVAATTVSAPAAIFEAPQKATKKASVGEIIQSKEEAKVE